jgi:hypothetical protein
MREFKRPGFIDFNFEYLHVGFVGAADKDFAVISIGLNPFSDPDNPRFAILVAGAQHPGTALALEKLAHPGFFVKHPFGGILEADVPGPDYSLRSVYWWDKIEKSTVDWHKAGKTDLSYSPTDLRDKLVVWSERIAKNSFIPQITAEEVKQHIGLIDALAAAKR